MFEATREELQVMSGEDPRIEVSKVTWKKDSSKQHKKARNFKKPKGNNEQVQKCDRCGYNAHKPQGKCPAKNESCNKCRKIGHFAQVCRSRKSIVNLLTETDYSGDEYSSDEEGADRDLQLLHVASLEINRINNQNPGEMNEMLEGIDHAYAIMDDILITGRNVAHHDSVLEAVLQRAKSNLRLNFDKVKYTSPKSNMWATLSQKKDSNLTQKK